LFEPHRRGVVFRFSGSCPLPFFHPLLRPPPPPTLSCLGNQNKNLLLFFSPLALFNEPTTRKCEIPALLPRVPNRGISFYDGPEPLRTLLFTSWRLPLPILGPPSPHSRIHRPCLDGIDWRLFPFGLFSERSSYC